MTFPAFFPSAIMIRPENTIPPAPTMNAAVPMLMLEATSAVRIAEPMMVPGWPIAVTKDDPVARQVES